MTIIRCYKKIGYKKLQLPKKEIKGRDYRFHSAQSIRFYAKFCFNNSLDLVYPQHKLSP